jgi:hypothetical protein
MDETELYRSEVASRVRRAATDPVVPFGSFLLLSVFGIGLGLESITWIGAGGLAGYSLSGSV